MNDKSFEFNLNSINISNNISNENLLNINNSFSLNFDENFDRFNTENFFEEKTNLNNIENIYNFNQYMNNEIPIKDSLKIENNSKFKTQETTFIDGKNKAQKEAKKNLLESKSSNNEKLLNKKRRNKRKNHSDDKKHSKYSSDNTIRKVKHITLENFRNFANENIKVKYNNNIGFGMHQKKLLTINQRQKVDATIEFNKQFMDKKLYEIFSDKISSRYTNFDRDFNKKLINSLMNEKDLEKREYFQKLFNLSFFDCLSHFRGSREIKELAGLKLFSEYISEQNEDEDYKNQLEYYINNLEEILKKKRSRKSKNKEDQTNQEKEIKTIMIEK
jgi:hypothetical protein